MVLFLLLEDFVLASDWVVLLELEFISVLLLILSSEVYVAFTASFFVACRDESYEFIL